MTKEDAVNGMLRDTADALDSMRTTTAVGHTPGPWTVQHDDTPWTEGDAEISQEQGTPFGPTEILFSITGGEDDAVIARLPWEAIASDKYQEELRANARLIAAAPEMLEALRNAALDLTDYTDEPRVAEIVTAIRAAIAKATNE
jgi:hypothetical protein